MINAHHSHDEGGNLSDYIDNLETYQYAFTEDDSEFLESRIFLKENMEFPEWGHDYEPYNFEHQDLPEKFRVGLHQE